MRLMKLGLTCVGLLFSAGQLPAAVLYSNGFETNAFDWDTFGEAISA